MIRKLELKDALSMLEWMHDTKVIENLQTSVFQNKTIEDCETFIKNSFDDRNTCHMAIVDMKDDYLGTVSLKNIDYNELDAEFAIVLKRSVWNKGYAKEAIFDILQIAFNKYKLNTVYCNVLKRNEKAISLYERMGWTHLVSVDNRYLENAPKRADGTVEDVFFFTIKKQDMNIYKKGCMNK